MRKIFLAVLLVCVAVGFFVTKINHQKSLNTSLINSIIPSATPLPSTSETKLLFVPYWSVPSALLKNKTEELLYFGITADSNGIDTSDSGYKKIQQFLSSSTNATKRLLVVRLTNSDIDSLILKDTNLQQKIISQSIQIAKDNSFDGVVLDFELSALSFQSVTNSISNFYSSFYNAVKKNNLEFDIALYGDTFYRVRPYDVNKLAKNADMVLVMAYDFHKARGNPGPNFPFNGNEQYGYDFTSMLDDFLQAVPKEKLGIVFGMFGYDWEVDKNQESLHNGKPVSTLEITNTFIQNCGFNPCKATRDVTSGETKIEYTDTENNPHIVWFEDQQSASKKKEYVQSKGITTTGFWAYSYY